MYYFGTLFDKNYLPRGLALRNSLRATRIKFSLFVLCLDTETLQFFRDEKSDDTIGVPLKEIEDFFPQLTTAKSNRSWAEFIFTLSPFWPLYLLKNFDAIPFLTTLDADIYFFSDPTPIFDDLIMRDILVTPHRFPARLKEKEIYGKYNVSFQVFKRSDKGFACLNRWAEQCAGWCYDKYEDNRYADQKYLDEWPELYGTSFGEISLSGAGIAPWNIEEVVVERKDRKLYVEKKPLIFVHFHLLRFLSANLIISGLKDYHVNADITIMKYLYAPYVYWVQFFMTRLGSNDNLVVRYYKKYSKSDRLKLFLRGGAWYFNSVGICVGMIRKDKLYMPVFFLNYRNTNG